jgi:hypothetical protein
MWGWASSRRRVCWALSSVAATALLAACTSAPEVTASPSPSPSVVAASTPGSPTPSAGPTATKEPSPSPSETEAEALTIEITIAGGRVTPNGEKIKVDVGQQVILKVSSDEDDEIHAHTDGNGYELEVKAGEPARGSFTLDSPGSFEVESHHLGKIIVILNAR